MLATAKLTSLHRHVQIASVYDCYFTVRNREGSRSGRQLSRCKWRVNHSFVKPFRSSLQCFSFNIAQKHNGKIISISSGMRSNLEAGGNLGPEVPGWAERLLCVDNTHCADGECESLHLPDGWQNRRRRVPSGPGKLIVCAGPERSGSTWLFNAVRLLFEQSGERLHSYWCHTITNEKLQELGVGRQLDSANILVKTHEWSVEWNPSTANLIILTERDICGVVNSYLRVGWLPKEISYLKIVVERYLLDHVKWKRIAHAVVQYEDLADVDGRELNCLNQLQDMLNLKRQTDSSAISAAIKFLPVPKHGGPDPVTKLWPRHMSSHDRNLSRRPSLSESECKILREHAAWILSQ